MDILRSEKSVVVVELFAWRALFGQENFNITVSRLPRCTKNANIYIFTAMVCSQLVEKIRWAHGLLPLLIKLFPP